MCLRLCCRAYPARPRVDIGEDRRVSRVQFGEQIIHGRGECFAGSIQILRMSGYQGCNVIGDLDAVLKYLRAGHGAI